MVKVVDKTGSIHRDLQIVKELGHNRVTCKCLKCGKETDYWKQAFLNDQCSCYFCGINRKVIDRTGQVFNRLLIIKELGNNEVICECLDCRHQDKYRKGNVVTGNMLCRNCKSDTATRKKTAVEDKKKITDAVKKQKIKKKFSLGF